MAKAKEKKPNLFMRIGMFIKQTIDETRKVVAPHGKELFAWSASVFIFVIFLVITLGFTTTICCIFDGFRHLHGLRFG